MAAEVLFYSWFVANLFIISALEVLVEATALLPPSLPLSCQASTRELNPTKEGVVLARVKITKPIMEEVFLARVKMKVPILRLFRKVKFVMF